MQLPRPLSPSKVSKAFSLIELMVVVAIIAILGTFALPAYHDYVLRTRVAETISWSEGFKKQIIDNMSNGAPLLSGINLTAVNAAKLPKALKQIDIRADNGYITLTYKGAPIDGKVLYLVPKINASATPTAGQPLVGWATGSTISEGRVSWTCRSADTSAPWMTGTLPGTYAPPSCSGLPME